MLILKRAEYSVKSETFRSRIKCKEQVMNICKYCVFLNQASSKSNYVCSIQKLKYPYSPGYYLKNPNEKACEQFRKREMKR